MSVSLDREHQHPSKIRAARLAKGWSQTRLAKEAGISMRTVFAIESGRPCHQATKRSLLKALGIPWEEHDAYF